MLSEQCDIVDVVTDGHALRSKAQELKPDLIVVDIGMPGLSGMEAAQQIKLSIPAMRFVFLTMMEDRNLAAAALRLAPVGYVLKHSAASELTTAIHEVLAGRSFLTQRMRNNGPLVAADLKSSVGKRLTPRQCDVLKLLAAGHLMKEVAGILQVSEKTVEFHKYQIMHSYRIRSNAELVLFALKNGLVPSA
jgi:DNA-binding NarL/FixJ family response regulator